MIPYGAFLQGVSSHGQPAHGSHSTSDKAQAFLSSVSHNPQVCLPRRVLAAFGQRPFEGQIYMYGWLPCTPEELSRHPPQDMG
jgi:hypothetical protein